MLDATYYSDSPTGAPQSGEPCRRRAKPFHTHVAPEGACPTGAPHIVEPCRRRAPAATVQEIHGITGPTGAPPMVESCRQRASPAATNQGNAGEMTAGSSERSGHSRMQHGRVRALIEHFEHNAHHYSSDNKSRHERTGNRQEGRAGGRHGAGHTPRAYCLPKASLSYGTTNTAGQSPCAYGVF